MRRLALLLPLLFLLVAPTVADAAVVPGPVGGARWDVPVIRLYDATPRLYREGIDIAIREWNASQVGIRFVRTSRRSNAHVVVGTARWVGPVEGKATLGMTRNAWIKLDTALIATEHDQRGNTIYNLAGGAVPEQIAFVMAHEMGHVLGLEHTRGCTLMTGPNVNDTCVETPPARQWACRLIQQKDVLAAARRYGGRGVVRPQQYCPLSATRAGAVGAVTATASSRASATKLSWKRTTNAYGYIVARSAAGGGCPATPDAGAMRRDAEFETFTDTWGSDTPKTAGRYCYAVWSKNGRGMLTGPARVFVEVTSPFPASISNLSATVAGSTVQFAWTNPAGTGVVRIYRSNQSGSTSCAVPPFTPIVVALNGATTASETGVLSGVWTYVAIRSDDPNDDGDTDRQPEWPSAPVCVDAAVA